MSEKHVPSLKEVFGMPVPPVPVVEVGNKVRNALGRMHSRSAPPFAVALERMFGLVDNKMLTIMVELEIPDLLEDGPRSATEIANETGADPDSMARMLRFLVSRDLLGVMKDGRYENNRVSNMLRRSHPWSWRDWVLFFGSEWNWKIWEKAKHSIMTGESGSEAAFGVPFFEYVNKRDPDAAVTFNGAMTAGARMQATLVTRAYDFSGVTRVCDVGGGSGAFLSVVLDLNPRLVATLFDLPEVVEDAGEPLDRMGVRDRCDIVGGDFFQEVPSGCDLYTLLAIVHDWNDSAVTEILANVRRAMTPGGKVLVVEAVLPENHSYDFANFSDLLMLVLSGSGRERTEDRFAEVFAGAGLRVARIIKLPSLFRLFELEDASSGS